MALPSVSKLLILPILAVSLFGCAQIRKSISTPTPEKPTFAVHLSLDHSPGAPASAAKTSATIPVFRPGEGVICTVEITNLLDKPVDLLVPYSERQKIDSNINFFRKFKDGINVVRCVPVYSSKDKRHETITLAPHTSLKRPFIFTNITILPGLQLLQVEYTPSSFEPNSTDTPVFSPFVEYKIAGERLWKRDPDGILLKEDAIRVAQKEYGKPVKSAEAHLIENEAGFLDWWVTLEKMPADVTGGISKLAYFINPYGAFVRQIAPVPPTQTEKANEKNSPAPTAPGR